MAYSILSASFFVLLGVSASVASAQQVAPTPAQQGVVTPEVQKFIQSQAQQSAHVKCTGDYKYSMRPASPQSDVRVAYQAVKEQAALMKKVMPKAKILTGTNASDAVWVYFKQGQVGEFTLMVTQNGKLHGYYCHAN